MPDSTSTTPAQLSNRDGLTALLMLVVIVGTLLLGYRQGASSPVAAEPVAVAEAVEPEAADAGYDLDRAMALAGQEVPKDRESYYFFAFVEEAPAEQEIGDLAEKMRQAAKEQEFLGISGPDATRNRRNLLSALHANEGQDLRGLVIIYVGPAAQQAELTQAVETTGAKFRFVTYPDGAQAAQPVKSGI